MAVKRILMPGFYCNSYKVMILGKKVQQAGYYSLQEDLKHKLVRVVLLSLSLVRPNIKLKFVSNLKNIIVVCLSLMLNCLFHRERPTLSGKFSQLGGNLLQLLPISFWCRDLDMCFFLTEFPFHLFFTVHQFPFGQQSYFVGSLKF